MSDDAFLVENNCINSIAAYIFLPQGNISDTSAFVQIYADMLTVCHRGIEETWGDKGFILVCTTDFALSSVGR